MSDALPFKDASFGAVTCRIAAHHFAELLPALRQVARVLRPGGSFLVEDILGHDDAELAAFMTDVERRRDPSHVRAFRQIEWTAFLRAAGLTVIDEAVVSKVRDWDDWTARAQMSSIAKRDLDRVVLAAPARCRDAFDFTVEAGRIRSFTTRLLLLRADRRLNSPSAEVRRLGGRSTVAHSPGTAARLLSRRASRACRP